MKLLSKIGAGLGSVRRVFGPIGRLFKSRAGFMRNGLVTALVWFIALLSLALGGFLVVTPIKELMRGETLGFDTALTFGWLLTGSTLIAGALGMMLHAPGFRGFLKVAFACSLPLPIALMYKTASMMLNLDSTTGSTREELKIWIAGGIELSAIFLVVSSYLFLLVRSRRLKAYAQSGSVKQGVAGILIGILTGAGMGSGLGFLTWVTCRWLGFSMNSERLLALVYNVSVEMFVGWGAMLIAIVNALRIMRRQGFLRRSSARKPPAMSSRAAPAPAGGSRPATNPNPSPSLHSKPKSPASQLNP